MIRKMNTERFLKSKTFSHYFGSVEKGIEASDSRERIVLVFEQVGDEKKTVQEDTQKIIKTIREVLADGKQCLLVLLQERGLGYHNSIGRTICDTMKEAGDEIIINHPFRPKSEPKYRFYIQRISFRASLPK